MNTTIFKTVILSFLIVSTLKGQSMEFNNTSFFNRVPSLKGIVVVSLIVAGAFTTYKLLKYAYNESKPYVHDAIHDKIADAIIVAVMPHSELENFSTEKQEEILRQKARLINVRKNVLEKLTQRLSESNDLSEAHQKTLQNDIMCAKIAFGIVDMVRAENPFEEEYEGVSLINYAIEKGIIDSIIASTKPDEECTPQELLARQSSEDQKAEIIEKLKDKVEHSVVAQFLKSSLLFNVLTA